MLSGVSPETSRPKELAAGAALGPIRRHVVMWRTLQRAAVGFSRQNGELEVRRCTLKRAPHDRHFTAAGLKCTGGYKLAPTEITAKVCDNPGVYLIFTTRHAIAVKTGESSFYYFEPENGLWLFNIRPEFRRAIHKNYVAEAAEQGTRWAAFELELG